MIVAVKIVDVPGDSHCILGLDVGYLISNVMTYQSTFLDFVPFKCDKHRTIRKSFYRPVQKSFLRCSVMMQHQDTSSVQPHTD